MRTTKGVNKVKKAKVEVAVGRRRTVALIRFQRGRYARKMINTMVYDKHVDTLRRK